MHWQTIGGQQRHRLYYAMKANRFAPLLTFLKQSGLCGIDACSPAEVEHALGCGFVAWRHFLYRNQSVASGFRPAGPL